MSKLPIAQEKELPQEKLLDTAPPAAHSLLALWRQYASASGNLPTRE